MATVVDLSGNSPIGQEVDTHISNTRDRLAAIETDIEAVETAVDGLETLQTAANAILTDIETNTTPA